MNTTLNIFKRSKRKSDFVVHYFACNEVATSVYVEVELHHSLFLSTGNIMMRSKKLQPFIHHSVILDVMDV